MSQMQLNVSIKRPNKEARRFHLALIPFFVLYSSSKESKDEYVDESNEMAMDGFDRLEEEGNPNAVPT
jgi:hypothetical protein